MITTGLGPCIGLGVVNTTTYKAALAHIDDTTTSQSVTRIIDNIRTNIKEELNIYIAGGNKLSYDYLSPIINWLQNIPYATIIFNKTFAADKSVLETQTLGIDAHGKFYTNEGEVFYTFIHPFKSPEVANIFNATNDNYEYDLAEVNFIGDNYKPIVELDEFYC